jgi:hypothetical protein
MNFALWNSPRTHNNKYWIIRSDLTAVTWSRFAASLAIFAVLAWLDFTLLFAVLRGFVKLSVCVFIPHCLIRAINGAGKCNYVFVVGTAPTLLQRHPTTPLKNVTSARARTPYGY